MESRDTTLKVGLVIAAAIVLGVLGYLVLQGVLMKGGTEIYFADYESIMDLLDNRIKMWKLIKGVGDRAGIGHRCFPHCVRATFATTLVERGMEDPVALTQIMGWADFKMGMQYISLQGISLKKKVMKIWNGGDE